MISLVKKVLKEGDLHQEQEQVPISVVHSLETDLEASQLELPSDSLQVEEAVVVGSHRQTHSPSSSEYFEQYALNEP